MPNRRFVRTVFTEENLNQILDIAKEMKVSWHLLFNFKIMLKNITSTKWVQRLGFYDIGSKNLKILVEPGIELELEKKHGNAWMPNVILVEIESIINESKIARENLS